MNTTKKGDLFEKKVHDLLLEIMSQDKFFIPQKRSLLFQKHKYFSKDREKEIVFDLVVESYREGADKPNLIVLIECKDKGKSISVEDIESFYSKKEQVARANCKCLFFTTSELQVSAFNLASNLGVGVCRVLDDDSMSWLLERTNKNFVTSPSNTIYTNVVSALTNEFFVTIHANFFSLYTNKPYMELNDLLYDILIEN